MKSIPGRKISSKSLKILVLVIGVICIAAITVVFVVKSSDHPNGNLLDQEISKMEKIVKADSENPDVHVQMALLYSESGARQKALDELQTALKLNPSHQGALVALADFYVASGKFKDSIPLYEKVIELNKDNPMREASKQLQGVYYYLGVAYFNLGQLQEAVTTLDQALSLDKTDADAWFVIGSAYEHLKQWDKAIEAFAQAVRFVPGFQEAYQEMAKSYAANGQTSQAKYAEAMVNFSLGNVETAITQLEPFVADNPDNAEAFLGLGLAYEKSGQLGKATTAFQRTLQLNPDSWLAQMKLQSLGVKQ